VDAVEVLYGTAEATPPSVTATGGFESYAPVDGLAPRELVVLGLDG
jgi:hypothetical protein